MRFLVDECTGNGVARWLRDERTVAKISVLRHLLRDYHDRLEGEFVVVSENQVRFGRH